jgi:uncharacterized damage-inducible protein DinB
MDAYLFLEGLVDSRKHFYKHLAGLPEDAWNYKPFAECKSLTETLAHMVVNDRMAVEALRTGMEPNYDAGREAIAEDATRGKDHLLGLLRQSHEALLADLNARLSGKSAEEELCIWGWTMPVYKGIPFLSAEDYYHSGQIAYVRMAVQPDWDYYSAIFSEDPGENPFE